MSCARDESIDQNAASLEEPSDLAEPTEVYNGQPGTIDRDLLAWDYKEVNCLLERYEGQDMGVPDKPLDITLIVTDEGTKLDRAPYANNVVIE